MSLLARQTKCHLIAVLNMLFLSVYLLYKHFKFWMSSCIFSILYAFPPPTSSFLCLTIYFPPPFLHFSFILFTFCLYFLLLCHLYLYLPFLSPRWILPLLYGKVFRSVSWVIQQGATTGIAPDPAGATPPSGPTTTPWSSQELLSTTGTEATWSPADQWSTAFAAQKIAFYFYTSFVQMINRRNVVIIM